MRAGLPRRRAPRRRGSPRSACRCPPSAFDATITSGSIPCCSKANQVPVRPQPDWTSSTISGIVELAGDPPDALDEVRRAPGSRRPRPARPRGSPRPAAGRRRCGSRQRALEVVQAALARAERRRPEASTGSAYGIREEVDAGHARWRRAPSARRAPVTAIAPCVLPWKPPWNGDDVAAAGGRLAELERGLDGVRAGRDRRTAIFMRSRISSGSIESWTDTKSSLSSVGKSRPWVNSVRSCSWTASTSSGWLCPSASAPAPSGSR